MPPKKKRAGKKGKKPKKGSIDEAIAEKIQNQLKEAIGAEDPLVFFERYDLDGNGTLDLAEFKNLIRVGLNIAPKSLSDKQIDTFVKFLDDDGGGELSIEEIADFVERGTATFNQPIVALGTVTAVRTLTNAKGVKAADKTAKAIAAAEAASKGLGDEEKENAQPNDPNKQLDPQKPERISFRDRVRRVMKTAAYKKLVPPKLTLAQLIMRAFEVATVDMFTVLGMPLETAQVVHEAFTTDTDGCILWNDFVELLASLGLLDCEEDVHIFERQIGFLIGEVSDVADTDDGVRPRRVTVAEFVKVYRAYHRKVSEQWRKDSVTRGAPKSKLNKPTYICKKLVFGMRVGFAVRQEHTVLRSRWQEAQVYAVISGNIQAPILGIRFRREAYGTRIFVTDYSVPQGPGAPEPSYAFEEVYMRFFKKYKLTTADGTELMTFKRKMMTIGNPSIAAYLGRADFDFVGSTTNKLMYEAEGSFGKESNFRVINSARQTVAKVVDPIKSADGTEHTVVQVEANQDMLPIAMASLLMILHPETSVELAPSEVEVPAKEKEEEQQRLMSPDIDIKKPLGNLDIFSTIRRTPPKQSS